MALLDDMRKRLEELDAAMEKSRLKLIAKYGENYVTGMIDTLLTDAEKAGLETEDEKMRALANKMLNPDGSIKDKYKDSEEAKYVRDWHEAQKLRPIVDQYKDLKNFTAEDTHKIAAVAQSVGLSGQENMHLQSENQSFKDAVESVMDQERSGQELVKNNTSLKFT